MVLSIEYCVVCNYRPIAASLAYAVKKETGVETVLVNSKDGAFEVRLDGDLVFSKLQVGRFPDHEEIVKFVRRALMGSQ